GVFSASSLLRLLSGRVRLDDADRIEPGALRSQRGGPAARSVEDEEADLVLWQVDRVVEADRRPLPCQLLRGRPRPLLAGTALSRGAACEIGLHEVARHAFDATTGATTRKGKNVATLRCGAVQPRRRASSARERTPSFAYTRVRCPA